MLGFSAFNERVEFVMHMTGPSLLPRPLVFDVLLYVVGTGTVALSIKPTMNLLSRNQAMNLSYNPFHLVNTYGAFGTVGRKRYEIVMEGTDERVITPQTRWQEYGFKAKPGDPKRMPPQVAPYHLRLDWLIWFLPFSVAVTAEGIRVWGYQLWFLRFVQRLLSGNPAILRLMGKNPFAGQPPAFVRALFYEYRYTDWQEMRETGMWWNRQVLGEYLPPVSVEMLKDT